MWNYRARHGYVHVANNLYQGWGMYAIGGSMNPRIKSESNVFISSGSNKVNCCFKLLNADFDLSLFKIKHASEVVHVNQVTWRGGSRGDVHSWKWKSKNDHFVNGAFFRQSGNVVAKPNYNRYQSFRVRNAGMVGSLTSSSGALRCTGTRCR